MDCSPDSRSVVYLRTFREGRYQELITVDLSTKKEEQLTFDKKNIDEVCWAPNGQIIYSTNKSGNTNLWMIPSSGGDPVQITKGSGPDLGIKISGDNKKLLYYQNQIVSDFWIGKTTGESVRRLTFDDLPKGGPRLSPDGTTFAFILSEPDPLRPKESIQISDKNGANRRLLVKAIERMNNLYWSPDGRWIAYAEGTNNNNDDFRKTYLVEVARPGAPKFLSDGGPSYWLDNATVIVRSGPKNLLVSIVDGTVKPFFIDTTSGVPILNGKYMFYRDGRFGANGRYIVPIDASYQPKGTARKIMEPYPFYFTGKTDYLYFMPENGKLAKLTLPDGKVQKVPGTFPGFTGDFSVSNDGKEIIYSEAHAKGKLVMIENPFK
jgi:Tol biopolymer transport system component